MGRPSKAAVCLAMFYELTGEDQEVVASNILLRLIQDSPEVMSRAVERAIARRRAELKMELVLTRT